MDRRIAGALLIALLLACAGCSGIDGSTTSTAGNDPPSTEASPVATTAPLPASSSSTPTTTTVSPLPTDPTPGGVVEIAMDLDLRFGFEDVDGQFYEPSLNPILVGGRNAQELARLSVPGAYRLALGSGEPEPWLVERLPTTENGGVVVDPDTGVVTVSWHISDEAVWADGTPITAADFAFTLEVVRREDVAIDTQLRALHEIVDVATIVADGKTFTASLTSPSPRYELLFEWVLPAHAIDIDTFGEDWNTSLWLSGGPFELVEYTPNTDTGARGDRLVYAANPAYWERDPNTGAALPYLDGIEVTLFTPGVAELTSIASLFRAGGIDALFGLVGTDSITALGLDNAEAEGWDPAPWYDTLYEMLFFNLGDTRFAVNPDSLNEHLEYRKAVLTAIDRSVLWNDDPEAVVTSIMGTSMDSLAHGPWDQYDGEVEDVDRHLEILGESIGRDFTISPPRAVYVTSNGDATIRIGEAVVEQLTAAGWRASTEFTGNYFTDELPNGLYDLSAVRQFALPGLSGLQQTFALLDRNTDDGLISWIGSEQASSRYTEIMEQASVTVDRTRLAGLLLEAERILADNAIVYPLVRRQQWFTPHWPDRIRGVQPDRHRRWVMAHAATWWSPQAGVD